MQLFAKVFNPPAVGTVVVDSTVEVDVKLEETFSAVVVVIISDDVQTELVVEKEKSETEIVELVVTLLVQSLQ